MHFFITHLLFTATYIILGLATAGLLPRAAEISGGLSALAGGGVAVLAAVIHVLAVQRAQRSEIAAEIRTMQHDHDRLRQDLDKIGGDVNELRERDAEADRGSDALVAEMKVLQTLLAEVVTHAQGRADFRETLRAARASTGSAVDPEPELGDREVLEIMRNALESNRVDLYLQPVVGLPARRVRFYETYSRVRDESGTVIYPRQYLHLAEKAGLVSTLDNMLLFRCVQVVRQLRKRRPERRFFVNVSSGTLSDERFFTQFVDFISRNPELADHIVFEVAQSDVVGADDTIDSRLDALADLGFPLSMDHVTDLDIDVHDLGARRFKYVKIGAPVFLQQEGPLDKSDFTAAYGRHGIELIIEKIESETTLVELLDHDIETGQGFLFGAPHRIDPENGKDLA